MPVLLKKTSVAALVAVVALSFRLAMPAHAGGPPKLYAAGPLVAAEQPVPQLGLVIQGKGGTSNTLTPEQIAALPHVQQQLTLKTSGGGEETVQFSGPLLWDVLAASGMVDMAKHAEHVRVTLRAVGKDNYSAAFVMAEFSPEFGGKAIIVADQANGIALPAPGLRLVVPGEKRAGRSVRDLVRISID